MCVVEQMHTKNGLLNDGEYSLSKINNLKNIYIFDIH